MAAASHHSRPWQTPHTITITLFHLCSNQFGHGNHHLHCYRFTQTPLQHLRLQPCPPLTHTAATEVPPHLATPQICIFTLPPPLTRARTTVASWQRIHELAPVRVKQHRWQPPLHLYGASNPLTNLHEARPPQSLHATKHLNLRRKTHLTLILEGRKEEGGVKP